MGAFGSLALVCYVFVKKPVIRLLVGVGLWVGSFTSGGSLEAKGAGAVAALPSLNPFNLSQFRPAEVGFPACSSSPVARQERDKGKPANVLVVYDNSGEWAYLGELYATFACNLLSRFGDWDARPVASYVKNQHRRYTAVLYLGTAPKEPLPAAFLEDVQDGTVPVMWIHENLHQLLQKASSKCLEGWEVKGCIKSPITEVLYKNLSFERNEKNNPAIHLAFNKDANVTTLATCVCKDKSKKPWAVRSGHFFYVVDNPLAFSDMNDRYLAFADLLFEWLAPDTKPRHRAMVRIEDVNPSSEPHHLKDVADVLAMRNIPFSVAVIPCYNDPHGKDRHNRTSKPVCWELCDKPEVVDALKYMVAKGGTLLMHGYSHQYSDQNNPYSGVTGDDFEFYSTHVDKDDYVIYDGPVASDSKEWVLQRIIAAADAFKKVGLPVPHIFEVPHYAGSVTTYEVVQKYFKARYERGLYFSGYITGQGYTVNYKRQCGQFFPFPVHDVYGSFVIPENLGNVEPDAINNHKPRSPEDILKTAKLNKAIRDGYASFFYHPYLGKEHLMKVVDGLKAEGWEFIAGNSLTE